MTRAEDVLYALSQHLSKKSEDAVRDADLSRSRLRERDADHWSSVYDTYRYVLMVIDEILQDGCIDGEPIT